MHIKIKFCMQKKLCFLKNVCLSAKFDLPLKKKLKKFFGQFQNYFAIKKILVIIFPYNEVI